MRTAVVIGFALAAAGPAHALDQSAHRQISQDACEAAGLPHDFCERVGTEAYDVDDYEWSHPEAHAQIGIGATACGGVNATLERLRMLGSDIRTSLDTLAVASSEDLRIHIATQLGRALHTIQDNCAHHGMPNPQHAWWSRLDACTGSTTSPDVQPDAMTCARDETAAAVGAFTAELTSAGIAASALDDLSEGWTHWPARADVCRFLHDAETWNGVDQRWNNDIVVPWLRDQLANAITSDDGTIGDACSVDLSVAQPAAVVDVSTPPTFCLKLKTYCLGAGGKEDGEAPAPPWEDDTPPASSGGCSIAGGSAGAVWLFALVALVVSRRRR
jgi:MYXO-CTERM domain-containing protein